MSDLFERLTRGESLGPRKAARRQLFPGQEVHVDDRRDGKEGGGGGRGALPQPISQMCVFVCSRLSLLLPGACLPPPLSFHSGGWGGFKDPRCRRGFNTQRPDRLRSPPPPFLQKSPASFNYKPILVLGTQASMRILSK